MTQERSHPIRGGFLQDCASPLRSKALQHSCKSPPCSSLQLWTITVSTDSSAFRAWHCQHQNQWPRSALCFQRSWDNGVRWTNTAKTEPWATAQHPPRSGQWEPPGLVRSPSPKAVVAFDTKAKLSECPEQPCRGDQLRDGAGGTSNPQGTDAVKLHVVQSQLLSQREWTIYTTPGIQRILWEKDVSQRRDTNRGIVITWPPNWTWERVTKRLGLSTPMWLLNTSYSSSHFLDSSRAMWPLLNLPCQLEITTMVMWLWLLRSLK